MNEPAGGMRKRAVEPKASDEGPAVPSPMPLYPPLRKVDAVTIPVPDLAVREAGGRVVTEPFDIPVGRVAVVADPFDNVLVLVDLSKGTYTTDADGSVTGVA